VTTRSERSTASEIDAIDVTINDREFSPGGMQLSSKTACSFSRIENQLSLEIRPHKDEVERDHCKAGFLMKSRSLADNDID